ncbi:MAG: hypothetical protein AAF710_04065 [Planctomycetota bacterium]
MTHNEPPTTNADTQVNWLELARLAAAGEGHADLGRGVRRLATLAAAVQRAAAGDTNPLSTDGTRDDSAVGAHGRAPQAQPPGTDAGRFSPFPETRETPR